MKLRQSSVAKSLAIAVFNLVVLVYLIEWYVTQVSSGLLLEYLRHLPLLSVVPTIFLYILVLVLHGLRLAILIDAPFGPSFRVVNIGAGLNAILPFRLGELARLYYAKKFYSLSATHLFAAGLVEKFFDLVALSGLIIVVLLSVDGSYIGKSLAALLFAMILAAYLSVLIFRRFSHSIEDWVSAIVPVKDLFAALREQGRVRHLSQICGYTAVMWIANVGLVYVAFAGFLPEVGFGMIDAISILLIIALAIALPGAPAGLGVFEAGIVAYLTQSRVVPIELALACAIVFHFLIFIPQVILMAFALLEARFQRR